MANVRNSNTFYIDTAAANVTAATAGNLALRNVKVLYIMIAPTGSTADFVVKDVTTGALKFSVDLATQETKVLDFSRRPIVFPNGISPSTVTNCRVTMVIEESGA